MKSLRFLTLSLLITAFAASVNAYNASYFTQTSRLSSGKWVKIKVTSNGIHQITYDQLRQWGFSNPEKVSVYGGGGVNPGQNFLTSYPDDLSVTPSRRSNDKLYFYGESGVAFNPTSSDDPVSNINITKNQSSLNAGYYLLSDSNPSDAQDLRTYSYSSGASSTLTTHNSFHFFKENCTNNGKGGANWFGPNFSEVESQHYYLTAADPVEGATGTIFYRWVGKSASSLSMACEPGFTNVIGSTFTNPSRLSAASTYTYAYGNGRYDAIISDNEDLNLDLEFNKSGGDEGCYAALDYVIFHYYRNNVFKPVNGQMPIWLYQPLSSMNLEIGDASDNLILWNVTNHFDVANWELVDGENENTKVCRLPSSYSGYINLIAFDPTSDLLPVEFVENVENQNIHGVTEAVNMLIITTKTLRPYAEELAEAHRQYQGMNVLVVEQEKIFNEFSYGTPSTAGYRRLARMLYSRHPNDFKYILLYGPASYDNSRIIFTANDNLLTYEAEYIDDARENTRSYCSDAFFGLIDASFSDYYTSLPLNKMMVGVGRIPAPTTSVAEQVNRKLINVLKNPQQSVAINKAIFLCDDGDSNGHLEQAEELVDTVASNAPNIVAIKAYNDLYPFTNYDAVAARSKITQSLSAGVGFFSYTGHGNPSAFNSENIWSKRFTNETQYKYLPFATLSTCDSYSFDRGDNGMAETFLYKEDGGMLGIVGASRTVYKAFNQYLNKHLCRAYCNVGPDDCIGDVFRIGHNMSFYGFHSRDLGTNTMCYNLCGDPAMPLYGPKYGVSVASVNNEEIADDTIEMIDDGNGNISEQVNATLIPIYPRAHNTVVGDITDSNGNVVSSFNGSVTISLYDAVDSVANLRQGNDAAITVATFHDLLAEVTAPVVNGHFSADVVFPSALRPDVRNKMTFYAFNGNMKERAVGAEDHVVVKPFDEEKAIDDQGEPAITEMYINTADFREGDIVESSFDFHATIEPSELGICNATSIIGSSTVLMLDNKKSFADATSALSADDDGAYRINFPISGLENGAHTLTLNVADNAGNRVSRTISFIVADFNVNASITVAENPARQQATFSIEDNLIGGGNYTLVIERKNGSNVLTVENASFPYEWDLTDQDNNVVADGEYFAYVIANNGTQFGSSPKIKLIVVKKAE